MPSRRLIVFGRLPEPGLAKTRLIPALGAAGAARLYQAFLDDAVRAATTVAGAETELWVPPRPDAEKVLSARYPDVRVREQRGHDLGARMATAFDACFSEGVDYAVLTGSDHPTLPPDMLSRGLDALIAAHLVIGPSADGGYYAIGLRRYAWPKAKELFEDLPWSSSRVLDITRQRAAKLGLCHVELPAWYDIDETADLERLGRDVREGSRTASVLRGLTSGPVTR